MQQSPVRCLQRQNLRQGETESPSKHSLLLLLARGPKEIRPAGASMAKTPTPHLEWQERTSNTSSRSFPVNAFNWIVACSAPKVGSCSLHTPCKHLISQFSKSHS